MDVAQLLVDVRAAVDAVKEKDAAFQSAAVAYGSAKQEHESAAEYLNNLRAQLNEELGELMPSRDSRVRIG